MKKQKLSFPLKSVVLSTIIFLALLFIISYSWKVLRGSKIFSIKSIVSREGSVTELSYLIGRNIFDIDLRKESGLVLQASPDCSKVRMIRLLPDRVYVDFVERKPLALVKLSKYFTIDENQVLYYPKVTGSPDLPVILGLERKIMGASPGRKYNLRELTLALNIIKELNSSRAIRNYKLKSIDVTSLTNTSIQIDSPDAPAKSMEIKVGVENIKAKFSLLVSLMQAARNDAANITYIDLRFKEPVIKFNETKKK
jgi:cell division septal protein FtsQ